MAETKSKTAKAIALQEKKNSIKTETVKSKDTQKIIIPDGMSKKEAADDLMNQWYNEEQEQDFVTQYEGWEWKDALRAIRIVIEDKFGWLKGGPASFWTGAPMEVSIVTGYKNGTPIYESAFSGPVKFPAWEDAKGQIGANKIGAFIVLKAKKKYAAAINTFFKEVAIQLKNDSIYKGKPVVATYDPSQDRVELEITELKENNKIILNENEELVVNNLIIGELEEKGKRTYLFTGDYGNGKSETAMRIGIEANKKGISFFYVKDSAIFDRVLGFAKNYEPCIVFVEDIDEIASGEERDARMNSILNTLDGVQTKGRDITVLFTTNHEKRINKALRRPGRIDLIVNFTNPNDEAKRRILETYFNHLTGSEVLDYEVIIPKLPDAQGAVIAEIAKRAVKLTKNDGIITTNRVLASVVSMEYHINFMKEEIENANELQKAMNVVRDYQQFNRDF